jgi:hypothetical protein
LRQASSSTICWGAALAAANSWSSSTERSAVSLHAFDLHVGGRDHVLALDLHAMAGIVDQRHLCARGLALERFQRVEQIGAGQIVMLRDLEAAIAQLRGDGLGVRHGIGEAGEMLVPMPTTSATRLSCAAAGDQAASKRTKAAATTRTMTVLAFPLRNEPSATSLE